MGTRKKPYRVGWARRTEGVAYVMATSKAEAERIAHESFDVEWVFEDGNMIGMPKASTVAPDEYDYYESGAYVEEEA